MVRLEAEVKQITNAIRMAAYNAETTLARALKGRYARASDEAYALIREALTASGDIIPGHGELRSSASTRSPPHGAPRPSPPSAISSTKPQAATPALTSSSATKSNPTLALHELPLYVRSPGTRARSSSATRSSSRIAASGWAVVMMALPSSGR